MINKFFCIRCKQYKLREEFDRRHTAFGEGRKPYCRQCDDGRKLKSIIPKNW